MTTNELQTELLAALNTASANPDSYTPTFYKRHNADGYVLVGGKDKHKVMSQLAEQGFVTVAPDSYSGPTYNITPTGRAYLAQTAPNDATPADVGYFDPAEFETAKNHPLLVEYLKYRATESSLGNEALAFDVWLEQTADVDAKPTSDDGMRINANDHADYADHMQAWFTMLGAGDEELDDDEPVQETQAFKVGDRVWNIYRNWFGTITYDERADENIYAVKYDGEEHERGCFDGCHVLMSEADALEADTVEIPVTALDALVSERDTARGDALVLEYALREILESGKWYQAFNPQRHRCVFCGEQGKAVEDIIHPLECSIGYASYTLFALRTSKPTPNGANGAQER